MKDSRLTVRTAQPGPIAIEFLEHSRITQAPVPVPFVPAGKHKPRR